MTRLPAFAFAALLALPLAGCGLQNTSATGGPSTGPSQETVDALTGSLKAAETAATIYVSLPLCPKPAPCRQAGVAAKIGAADTQADALLKKYRTGAATSADVTAAIAAMVATIPTK